jgi:AcrR family transcriptional regulator
VGRVPRGRTRDNDAHQRILDATIALVGADGAGNVCINDIAAAAGVGKQTIYRWWPSKHAVVIEALVVRSIHDTPFRDSGDARRDLRDHLRGVVKIFNSPTGALIRELVAEAQTDRTVAEEFRERFWQPRRDLSIAFLRRAIERGQVRPDLDVEATLDAIYSPLWARLLIRHQPINNQLVDHVLDVVWPGLSAGCASATDDPSRKSAQ